MNKINTILRTGLFRSSLTYSGMVLGNLLPESLKKKTTTTTKLNKTKTPTQQEKTAYVCLILQQQIVNPPQHRSLSQPMIFCLLEVGTDILITCRTDLFLLIVLLICVVLLAQLFDYLVMYFLSVYLFVLTCPLVFRYFILSLFCFGYFISFFMYLLI